MILTHTLNLIFLIRFVWAYYFHLIVRRLGIILILEKEGLYSSCFYFCSNFQFYSIFSTFLFLFCSCFQFFVFWLFCATIFWIDLRLEIGMAAFLPFLRVFSLSIHYLYVYSEIFSLVEAFEKIELIPFLKIFSWNHSILLLNLVILPTTFF